MGPWIKEMTCLRWFLASESESISNSSLPIGLIIILSWSDKISRSVTILHFLSGACRSSYTPMIFITKHVYPLRFCHKILCLQILPELKKKKTGVREGLQAKFKKYYFIFRESFDYSASYCCHALKSFVLLFGAKLCFKRALLRIWVVVTLSRTPRLIIL